MSFRYFLHTLEMRILGTKKMTQMRLPMLMSYAKQAEEKSTFLLPDDSKDFTFHEYLYHEKTRTLEKLPATHATNKTLAISRCVHASLNAKQPKQKAILYIYGNGMLMPPHARYLQDALNLGLSTKHDIWYPLYPTCTHANIEDAIRMIRSTYAHMLETYKAEDISIYGFSSGAALAIATSINIGITKEMLSQPARIIAISPLSAPSSPDELTEMLAFERYDIALHPRYFQHMRSILVEKKSNIPEYMISLTTASFAHCAPIHIYAGGNEALSVKARALAQQIKDSGGNATLTIANRMCHCYCTTDAFPEAFHDYHEICKLIMS